MMRLLLLEKAKLLITVSFKGNEKYAPAENKIINVAVNLNDASVSVLNNTVHLNVDGNYKIDAITTPVGLDVYYGSNDKSIVTVSNNGVITAVGGGNAVITLTVGDNILYSENSTTITVFVSKEDLNATITTKSIKVGEDAIIEVTGLKDATGKIIATVNGKTYNSLIVNGKSTIIITDLKEGNFTIPIIYEGNRKYNSFDSKITINVENTIVLSAPDVTKYYHGPERFVIILKDNNTPVVGKVVTIYLNNLPYQRTTDANGQGSIAINLNSGVHHVTSEFKGIKVQSTVTVKPTISGNNVTKIYRNDTQYYAKFIDSNGNLLKNTDVYFNINGVFYTRKTNDQGVAKMNINLLPGEYIITVANPVSSEQYSNVIKVLPSVIAYDLTKYYKNASRLTFMLLDNQGRPVGAGVSATININGVLYTRQTNASGYINMNINLNPGTYIATIDYNGLMASSTVKILPILEAKDVVMKYRDGTKFEAKLVDGQGRPFAAQTITFNINGVMYNRITDASGVARLNLNLMAGEYIITSMYENGATIANKVTIRS